MGLQAMCGSKMSMHDIRGGGHKGGLEEDGECGGREQQWEEVEEEGQGRNRGRVWVGHGGIVEEGREEMGGVGAMTGSEVGHNVGGGGKDSGM